MEEDNENPSELNSFQVHKALNTKIFDLNKKRKLQVVQFGLPMPKHKCGDHRLPPEHLLKFEEDEEVEKLIAHVIKENAERQAIDVESDHESGKDSNSFVGDSDSFMSAFNEVKSEIQVIKIWPCDRPSTSSFSGGGNNSMEIQSSSDNMTSMRGDKDKPTFIVEEHDPSRHFIGLKMSQNLEEQLQELGSHYHYGCPEHETDSIEPYADNELDNMLFDNGVNPNVYVLSSGRWSVNQGAETTKQPTIDQEFEQYFSMLML